MTRRKSKKKNIIIAFIIGITAALFIFAISVIIIFLMAVYKPAEYNPQPVDFSHQERAVDQAIALIADIHNNVYASDNFTEVVEVELLNTLLLHNDITRVLDQQMANRDFSIKYPQLSLKNGQIIFYVTAKYARHDSVISVAFEPEVLGDGMLQIKLNSIKSGALGIPKMILRKHLVALADNIKQMVEDSAAPVHPEDKKQVEKELGKLFGKSLPELLRNDKIEINPLITDPENNDLNIRLSSISCSDQKLSLTFSKTE